MVEKMNKVQKETETALTYTVEDIKQYYVKQHWSETFQVEDLFWLGAENLKTQKPGRKLN